jgi:hypothetical protein
MVSLTAAEPGATDTACIQVTYNGSLDSAVSLFAQSTGALAPYLDVTITRGTDTSPAFDDCTGFLAEDTDYIGGGAGVIYSGPLAGMPADPSVGIVDPPGGGPETWSTGETHSYKFSVVLANDPAARGQSADATFMWEAHNL